MRIWQGSFVAATINLSSLLTSAWWCCHRRLFSIPFCAPFLLLSLVLGLLHSPCSVSHACGLRSLASFYGVGALLVGTAGGVAKLRFLDPRSELCLLVLFCLLLMRFLGVRFSFWGCSPSRGGNSMFSLLKREKIPVPIPEGFSRLLSSSC